MRMSMVATSRWPKCQGDIGTGMSGPPQDPNGKWPFWPEQRYTVIGEATQAEYVAYCHEMGWEPNSEALARRPYYYFIATD